MKKQNESGSGTVMGVMVIVMIISIVSYSAIPNIKIWQTLLLCLVTITLAGYATASWEENNKKD